MRQPDTRAPESFDIALHAPTLTSEQLSTHYTISEDAPSTAAAQEEAQVLEAETPLQSPSSKRQHNRLTPLTFTISPVKKRTRFEDDDQGLGRSNSRASTRTVINKGELSDPSERSQLRHADSLRALRAPGINRSPSRAGLHPEGLRAPSPVLTGSHSMGLRPSASTPTLNLKSASPTTTDRRRDDIISRTAHRIRGLPRKVSGGKTLFFSKRDHRPSSVIRPPTHAPSPYTTVREIRAHRVEKGQTELLVVREGFEGRWEPYNRVAREAPELVEQYNVRFQQQNDDTE